MQISDSGFRGKINVVSLGDSAKRASPGGRAGFSHVNARADPPPCKHPLSYHGIKTCLGELIKMCRSHCLIFQYSDKNYLNP